MVHIINTSIDQEIFPKISRVCPIPKTDNPTSIKGLCPFIETQILYIINQSGFHKGHLTNMPLLKLRDEIGIAMKRSELHYQYL